MPEYSNDLVQYRLTKAEECLKDAGDLLNNGSFSSSINRSYYAMFTAARAVLAQDGKDFSKNSGVISYFQRYYVKTGLVEKRFSKYLMDAFQFRNNADYADFYIVLKEDAEEQYLAAVEFLKMVRDLIEEKNTN